MNLFTERLDALLKEHNLSRLALANKINSNSTTINGYFNNNYYPAIPLAIRMAKFFNCSLDYLFGLSEEKATKHTFQATNYAQNFISNFSNILKTHKMPISRAMKNLKIAEYSYYRWKRGILPKTLNIVNIAEYFDISVDYLLFHAK